jgi:hypothetical protein
LSAEDHQWYRYHNRRANHQTLKATSRVSWRLDGEDELDVPAKPVMRMPAAWFLWVMAEPTPPPVAAGPPGIVKMLFSGLKRVGGRGKRQKRRVALERLESGA